MARMLKRWESPRREGRNHKGKGGSARQRQLKKQTQQLRKKLKDGINQDNNSNDQSNNQNGKRGDDSNLPAYFLAA